MTDDNRAKVLDRIAKLLRMADDVGSPNEAAIAARRAPVVPSRLPVHSSGLPGSDLLLTTSESEVTTMEQIRLDVLCHDRRTYSPYCVGSRADIDRALAALGQAPGYRIYKADKQHKAKLPHSIKPRTEQHTNTGAYIAWLMADRSRVAYVFPWSQSQMRESDKVRREIEGRGIRTVEVDPADYITKNTAADIQAELAQAVAA